MTPDRLRELIERGESLDVEFKGEEHGSLSDRQLIEAVVCLANRPWDTEGWLLVGVEDDGRLTGAHPRHEAGLTDARRVEALIANRTRPSMSCRTEVIDLGGKSVLAIQVPASRSPVGTSDGLYARRILVGHGTPGCVPFHFHEMQSQQADRGLLDYSALVIPGAEWNDLDPLEFERFRRSIREGGARGDRSLIDLPDVELAKALGAVTANGHVTGVRALGLLLFGRDESLGRLMPTHEVAFQKLTGARVEVNDFVRYPLVRAMEKLLGRFRALNREQELMVGMLRVGVPDYPEAAFREAVANALIHRDYSRLGAVHVQWHDERLEISNPGGLPEGVRLDNLLVTPPRPRNPLLADAFKRAGLVERTARGIDRIFEEQLRNGRPAPNYDRTTEAGVVVVLAGGQANLEFVRMVSEEGQAGRVLGLSELLVLNALQMERRLTSAEAAALMQSPESDARTVLGRLVESGLVDSRGDGRGRSYHLSAQTYLRLGDKAAYVRQHGFEPLQQEQMVLQYVEKHGKITRAETADLCRTTSDQAKRLLARLTNGGKLVRHGMRRAAWYERP